MVKFDAFGRFHEKYQKKSINLMHRGTPNLEYEHQGNWSFLGIFSGSVGFLNPPPLACTQLCAPNVGNDTLDTFLKSFRRTYI